LFLYAQELSGLPAPSREDLNGVLKGAKVYDGNARTWLKKRVGFSVDGEQRLTLIVKSREEAVKTLGEALDASVPDKWNPDTRPVKPRAPRKKA